MNDLSIKQNSKDFLSLLKLQRYKYNIVSKVATINFILSVIIPIFISFIGFLPLSKVFVLFINLIGAICTIICLWLSYKIKNLKDEAAQIQYLFDVNLFGMKTNPFITNLQLTELLSIAQKSKIEKLCGLENWYSIKNTLHKNDAIYSCQKQNIRWDKNLRKIYLTSVLVLCSISLFIILSIGILTNTTFNILWSYIFLLLPIIVHGATFIFTSIDNLNEQNKLNSIFNKYDTHKNLTLRQLEALEEKIYFYRKELIKIPNWFFKLFKKSMQEEAEDYAQVESEQYLKNNKK